MNKPKVFLSGGFKSNWQKAVIDEFKENFTFFNPREHALEDANLYTTWDIHYVRECDIFFGYMEASNPSGYGLAFELGVAFSLNKTILLVDERSHVDPIFAKYYKILHKSAGSVFSSLHEGMEFLRRFSN